MLFMMVMFWLDLGLNDWEFGGHWLLDLHGGGRVDGLRKLGKWELVRYEKLNGMMSNPERKRK